MVTARDSRVFSPVRIIPTEEDSLQAEAIMSTRPSKSFSIDRLYDDAGEYRSTGDRVLTPWIGNGLGACACAFLLGVSYYLEYMEGFQPCPLCLVQRLLIAILGLLFLTATSWRLRQRTGRRLGKAIVLLTLLGAAAAGYQLWLQHYMASTLATCLPPLAYLLSAFPPAEAFSLILKNPAGCNDIQWIFMGLSLPAWTSVSFVGFGVLGYVSNRPWLFLRI
jgi:disulfide bond formation protein DsbB